MRHLLLSLLFTALPATLLAEIYTWQTEDGTTVYSDQPQPGAVEVSPSITQTYTATTPENTASTNQQSNESSSEPLDDPDQPYSRLMILKPDNDSAIRSNNGNVDIEVALIPELAVAEGHYFTALIDGRVAHKKAVSRQFTINNVDRGTHSLVIEVRQKNEKVLITSAPLKFHLLRMSVLFKKPAP